MNIGLILFLIFMFLLLLNTPIAVALGVAGLICIHLMDVPLDIFPMIVYASVSKFTLLAVPFFIMAGVIMEKAGISERLIKLASKMVGHLPAGLAMVTIITACFFAAISGSGPATVAALGTILIPAMVKAGYDKGMASALLASAGGIGIVIPPSIPFVIFAVIAGVSVGRMFIAGIIPGLLIGLGLFVASLVISLKSKYIMGEKASFKELMAAFIDALWGLMTPVIILGGIYGGIFTPTEAAAVGVVYGLFVGVFIYKQIKVKQCIDIVVESAITTAVVMLIIANASLFAWVVTTGGIAESAGDLMVSLTQNKYLLLLLMNVILLVAGCFIDTVSAYYILVPIFLPIIYQIGYDPIAFGVFMTVNLAIGLVTPPVGVNLYVACGISKISLKEISRSVGPFLLASIVILFLITYFPEITLWLPNVLGSK